MRITENTQNLLKIALLIGILIILIVISFQFNALIEALEKLAYTIATGTY